MTALAAIPYDFNELRETEAGRPSYSEEDLEKACAEARANALRESIISVAQKQTEVIDKLLAHIETSRDFFYSAIEEQRETLTQTARTFIERYFRNIATKRETDTALALLDDYLAMAPDKKPVALALPEGIDDDVTALLQDSLNERNVSDFVELTTRGNIADGDCRIEWRGGAMARNLDEMLEEIDRIFSSHGENRNSTTGKAPS
jgi:flagellar biosynthesis/type III secretory pathway protein FliH